MKATQSYLWLVLELHLNWDLLILYLETQLTWLEFQNSSKYENMLSKHIKGPI